MGHSGSKPSMDSSIPPWVSTVRKDMCLFYFPINGKGTAAALALSHSGCEWEGSHVQFQQWGEMKPTTPWGHVPLLSVPGLDEPIGHEMAILNFIGRKFPAMGGETEKDFAT